MWNCHENLTRAAALIPECVDAALITSEVSRQYLLHFPSTAGYLLLTREHAVFLVDSRYTEKAQKTFTGCEIVLLTSFSKQLREYFTAWKIKTLAVESSYMTLREYNRLQKVFPEFEVLRSNHFDSGLLNMRRIKSADEICRMKEAQKITDEAFRKICEFISAGVSEKGISARLEYEMKLLGADGFAFDTIVVSGKNSSMPHGTPSSKKVEAGDFITMDFGAMLDGYMSDMTRTVAVGKAGEEERHVYKTVLEAQREAFKKIRPGAVCMDVDKAARTFIADAGYGGYFGHGLGHSLGVEIHESPAFNMSDLTDLEPGMVLSVEPGIYLPGKFGVRIEDVIVVTEDGFENLTKSPKELLEL